MRKPKTIIFGLAIIVAGSVAGIAVLNQTVLRPANPATESAQLSQAEENAMPTDEPTGTPEPTPTDEPTPTPLPPEILPYAGNSSVLANPTAVPADGSSAATVTVTVKNNTGQALAGYTVSLTFPGDTKAKYAATSTNITNSTGQAVFSVTSTKPGTDKIDVTAKYRMVNKTMKGLGTITFSDLGPTPTPSNQLPDNGHSRLSADPAIVGADNTSQSTVTVTINDTIGNPIIGAGVTLLPSDSSVSIANSSSNSNVTNSTGQAVFKVKSANANTVIFNVTVTFNGHSYTFNSLGSVTFATSTPTPTP
jgi:hypothetical protein